MELTAGQGTVIGSTFEEMALLLKRIPAPLRKRVGVCLDTAHVFAAGYDLIDDYDGVWARFDDVLGLARLGLLHLNDSKAPLGSRKDRHELIGDGAIGAGPFAKIMRDPRLRDDPQGARDAQGRRHGHATTGGCWGCCAGSLESPDQDVLHRGRPRHDEHDTPELLRLERVVLRMFVARTRGRSRC